MVKRNKKSNSWLKKTINKKLYYSSILFTLLICVLIVYAYSLPSIGIPLESNIEFDFQNLQNLFPVWTSIPPKNHMTVVSVKIPAFLYDHLGPTVLPQRTIQPLSHHEYPPGAMHNEQLPNQNFDRLTITETKFSKTIFTKVITDQNKINELYEDIKNLPNWPTGTINCPVDFGIVDTLDFYANDKLTLHALYRPTGCRGVNIANYQGGMDMDSQGNKFNSDLSALIN